MQIKSCDLLRYQSKVYLTHCNLSTDLVTKRNQINENLESITSSPARPEQRTSAAMFCIDMPKVDKGLDLQRTYITLQNYFRHDLKCLYLILKFDLV